jgi:hypothetical protein
VTPAADAVSKPKVQIFTDGACSGNPGPGGWGAILRHNSVEKELKGGEASTTNNRMELMAAISALETLKRPSLYRFKLSARRDHQVDPPLETEPLAHQREGARQKRRTVATAGRGDARP